MTLRFIIPFILLALVLQSCEEPMIPKPRGFQRIDLPQHEYTKAISPCGFQFDIPVYARMLPDTHPMAEKCWYNIYYEPFDATLHLSFKSFKSRPELIQMGEDARSMVYKHTVKADEIYESVISNKHIKGMLYELLGSTATNFQFYVTDTSSKFILGSLYFNTHTNTDSIEPAFKHLRQDIFHMLESLRWQHVD
jgi:gliding motility-associated lipoprotein GldD